MNKSDDVVAPLGNYITLSKRKNKNLESINLVGLSMFAGVVRAPRKVSLSYLRTGWLAEKGDFIIDLVHIQDNAHLSVDINRTNKLMVVSHIYNVFKITNPQLNGEYLLLILKNSITELRLKWACHGSVRGTLSWKNFANIPISVPLLDIQERIVYKYQIISRYINLKKRINELLERWMTSVFHFFSRDQENLVTRSYGEMLSVIQGGRPPRGNKEQEEKYFCKKRGIPWLQARDITKKGLKFVDETGEQLTKEGFKRANCHMVSPKDLIFIHNSCVSHLGDVYVNSSSMTMNTNFWGLSNKNLYRKRYKDRLPITFIYFLIKENIWKLKRLINMSTAKKAFDLKRFLAFKVQIPPRNLIDQFNEICEPIFELQRGNEQTIKRLLRLQKCWVESLD